MLFIDNINIHTYTFTWFYLFFDTFKLFSYCYTILVDNIYKDYSEVLNFY